MAANYTQFLSKLPDITNYDVYQRLTSQLPHWWGSQQFAYNAGSVLNTTLWSFNVTSLGTYNDAGPLIFGNYAQYQYILAQMRFGPNNNAFMTDFDQLNLFAQDFFGSTLPRHAGENNVSYKARIFANMFAPKATRQGMDLALYNLTGFHPIIFEPWNIENDAMFYGLPTDGRSLAQCAYGQGKYGSGEAYQAYIDVLVPENQGMGLYPGYDLPGSPMPPYLASSLGGYGSTTLSNVGTSILGSDSFVQNITTIAQIAQVINATKVYGTQVWFNVIYETPSSV